MNTVRCKMVCIEKTTYQNSTGVGVKLGAVYGDSPENKAFYDATPSGQITVNVKKAEVGDFFVLGGQYYVDFSPAPKE